MQLVTVDIGGTHARFALATVAGDGSIELGEPATLHTRDHASFQTAWEDFARMQGGSLPDAVAIAVADPVKPTTPAALAALRDLGLRVAMITGDNAVTAGVIAGRIGITDIRAGVLPDGKGEAVRAMGAGVAFVGDGI